jgi:hypothetical protein
MFSTPPPQGEGKISCPRKLTFLDLHQHEFYHDNENGDDHLNLAQCKHIDLSLFLLSIIQSTYTPTICVFENVDNGFFAMFNASDKTRPTAVESTVT